MTLQQLQYIVAVNQTRHFVKAAQSCGVSQPTLSAMIQKLENELDVKIFDREKSPIEPTEIGAKIIAQSETALNDVRRIKEVVLSEMNTLQGSLNLGILPTIAPYIVPRFITRFKEVNKKVSIRISEMTVENIITYLRKADLDMAIVSTPINDSELYEIPIYNERFLAYFSPKNPCKCDEIGPRNMPKAKLWVLEEGHCISSEEFNFCHLKAMGESSYHAGSIETLIRIVDENGGYTVIPELHTQFLSDKQKSFLRPIEAKDATREVSLVIRKDYIKEKMLNAVAEIVKEIIPETLQVEKIKKYAIRL